MFLLAVAGLVLLIWAIGEVLTTREEIWHAAGLNQWMWLGVLVFLPLIGIVLYMGVARGRLRQAGAGDSVESSMIR